MTTSTIDSLITTYQTRRAEQQAAAEEQKKAKAAAALEHAKAVLAEKFGSLWQYVAVVDVNVYLDHSRGTHSVRLDTLIDACNCELCVDTNDKAHFVVGGKTFYHNQTWAEDDWGEFFTTVRSVAVEQREKRIDNHSYAIRYAETDAQVRECLAAALAEFPDEQPAYGRTVGWQAIADARLAELLQRAEELANERAQREAGARDYEARQQAAQAEADKFQPFFAYQIHYAIEQPGDEDDPFTTTTVYVLHPKPDADGYYATIWCGKITKSRLTFVARTDLLEITAPDDKHAKCICHCDFEAGVYIRRTPDGAELLSVKSA